MSAFLNLIAAIFKNEPIERLMFMVVIGYLLIFCSPEWVMLGFNEKIGLPYSYQIFSFAISYLFSLFTPELLGLFLGAAISKINKIKNNKKISRMNAVIDSFSDDEIKIISECLELSRQIVFGKRNNPSLVRLVSLGVLRPNPAHLLQHKNPEVMLDIEKEYWLLLQRRWSVYLGKLR